MGNLDTQLLLAHEIQDHAALVALYTQAADQGELANNIEVTCFFLTQAFIFALECDHPTTEELNRRLVAHGREEPL